jgi:hypothetical protein
VAASALVAWIWTPPSQRIIAGLAVIAGFFLDAAMLAWLPRTQRSWGPVTPPLLGLAAVRLLLWLGSACLPNLPGLALALGTNSVLSVVAFYATWIEPFQVQVIHQTYAVEEPLGKGALRILHLSDIHFEAWSRREHRVLNLVDDLRPDLIVLTGDYLNLSSVYDPTAQADARDFLARLEAPLGVYAVTGSPAVDVDTIVPGIFDDLPIHWLDDEAIPLHLERGTLWLLGLRNTYDEERDLRTLRKLAASVPSGDLRILLYHTPDLMPEATRLDLDLYLCGHTHGGQICLPLYGALATSSRWGKRYEHGRYQTANTTLYVSRGLGLEGLGAPRARFFARPEIILWHLE